MGKCITTDNTIKRLTELERQRCCNRNQFLPTFDDFPTTGEDNVLYIDKEKSKIYLWNGSIYITADDLVGHTNIVATTTYDSLNPLTGWVAPTTPYFGNTATVLFTDDIIVNFTFNGTIWEEKIIDDTAISGIKTANTVYVDGTYGDDTTGQRESRDFPFQTLDAAIAVCETGDLLKVFPGTYTQTTTIQNLINIECENGVDWTFTGNFFNNTPDWATDVTTTWTFDVLRSTNTTNISLTHNFGIKNSLGDFVLNANKLEYVCHTQNNVIKQRSINVRNLVNSYICSSSLSPAVGASSEINLGYYESAAIGSASLISAQMGDSAKLICHIKSLKSVNSLTGYGNSPTIGYFFGSDAGIKKQYTTLIDNVTHDDPNIYVTPSGPLDDAIVWTGASAATPAGKLAFISSGARSGSNLVLDIKNIESTGHGVFINGSANWSNSTLIVNIKGTFEKGIPIMTSFLQSASNSKLIFNLDLECHTSMGLFLGGYAGQNVNNNIAATNQIIVTGRIKTRYAGMSCISIGTGSGASNNTNGTILLKDLTLINDGTVSPIMCAVAENVLIQNVVTNSLVVDANITEVGQSIIRNTNYK